MEKLRKATNMAAVCKFRGDIFWFGLFPSVAQLSSAFPYLSCFPNAADMLPLSSSSTSMASSMMTLLTNQRPRHCDKTEGQKDILTI